jgi:hypothetical protein
MKSISYISSILIILFSSLCFGGVEWNESKEGVAWEANKTLFLFKKAQPVGYNYSSKISFIKNKVIEVIIPIDKFDSQESARDSEVVILLKGNIQKNMIFKSKAFSKKELTKLHKKKLTKIEGDLSLGGKSYPLVFVMTYDDKGFAYGTWKGKMSSFDIKPPGVLGGVVSNVHDFLKLHVKMKIDKIK